MGDKWLCHNMEWKPCQCKYYGIIRNVLNSPEDLENEHYVGYPAMHSICRNHHQNIRVVLQTWSCATYDNSVGSGPCSWNLISQMGRKDLGAFYYLFGSGRLSATNNRAEMRSVPLDVFKDHVSCFESVPSFNVDGCIRISIERDKFR